MSTIYLYTTMLILTLQGLCLTTMGQNVSINVLTRESGVVRKGEQVFFEVTVNNTSAVDISGAYKLKAQISIADSSIVSIEPTGHQLPTGWKIVGYSSNVLTLSNGRDLIAPNDARTILIALKGRESGGPITISGQLYFSNGIAPGTEPGTMNGDNPADNYSTSSCKVID